MLTTATPHGTDTIATVIITHTIVPILKETTGFTSTVAVSRENATKGNVTTAAVTIIEETGVDGIANMEGVTIAEVGRLH
jgi:hypothetical protein